MTDEEEAGSQHVIVLRNLVTELQFVVRGCNGLIAEHRARDQRVLALLKRVEWGDDKVCCPECGLCNCHEHEDGTTGHKPGCELVALIKELEG
jgi:hypothetical protein